MSAIVRTDFAVQIRTRTTIPLEDLRRALVCVLEMTPWAPVQITSVEVKPGRQWGKGES